MIFSVDPGGVVTLLTVPLGDLFTATGHASASSSSSATVTASQDVSARSFIIFARKTKQSRSADAIISGSEPAYAANFGGLGGIPEVLGQAVANAASSVTVTDSVAGNQDLALAAW